LDLDNLQDEIDDILDELDDLTPNDGKLKIQINGADTGVTTSPTSA